MKKMIRDLPKIERPREKLLRYSPKKLSDEELLAIILRTGTKGRNVIDLAKEILRKIPREKFNNLSVKDFNEIKGIGEVKACEILASIEFTKRINSDSEERHIITPKDVWKELRDIRASKKEHFYVIYLDSRKRKIGKDLISLGTLNASLVHPREVFENAITNHSNSIVLSHNHPSSDVAPSQDDIQITRQLVRAGELLGINVIDHVIISESKWFSMAENKLI